MKRLLWSLLILVCLSIGASAQCVKILGVAEKSGKVNTAGVASTNSADLTFPSAVITIYNSGTLTPATLWTNATCSVSQANPLTAASDASYSFFILSGATFDVKTAPAGGSPSPFTRSGYTAPSTSTSGGSITRVAKLVVTSTYTVLAGDAGKQLVFNNAGAVAVTLPQAGTGSFTTGYWVDASVVGGGTVTITPTTSTINSATSLELTSGTGISGLMNDGTNWYGVVGGSSSVAGNCPTGIVCPDDYGAIHDGSSHLLSSRYGTLAAAQAAFNGAYNFVTSLSQQIDYAALKAASNAAFGADQTAGAYITPSGTGTTTVIVDLGAAYPVNSLVGQYLFMRYPNGFIAQEPIASNTATTITLSIALPFDYHPCAGQVCLASCALPPQTFACSQYAIGTAGEHAFTNAGLNKPLFLNGGTYNLGSDTWLIRNLVGGHIYGVGRNSTVITSSSWAFQTDGLWYSKIEGILFKTSSATAGHGAADIDGNVPGHPYTTRTVQQNTFSECGFDGAEGTYAFALNRQGGSSSQGENLYVNCTWSAATVTYYQNGFNALNNLILRGDMQDYTTGIYISAGSIRILGTSMESTRGYAQITDTSFIGHGGYDIDCSASGVLEPIIIEGVRSESLRFFIGSSAQTGVLIGNQTTCGTCTTWSALGGYTANQILVKTSVSAGVKIYRVTTAGTSGAVEPTWPNSGTVADGSVVWTELEYYVVDASTAGNITFVDPNVFQTGNYRFNTYAETRISPQTTSQSLSAKQYSAPAYVYFMDTTAGSLTFNLGDNSDTPDGQLVTIKKVTTDANTVTISSTGGNGVEGGGTIVIPGGSFGFVTLQYAKGNSVPSTWWIVSKSFGINAATLNGATFAAPGTIGGSTPGAATFITLTSSSTTTLGATTGTSFTVTNAALLNEGRLSTTAAVDMNTATATTLFTCPSGKSCIVTRVVVRNASTSLTTASYSFGWTGAAYADVIANATHTELTGATLLTIIQSKTGATLGTSTGLFKVLMNTLQGGAATTTIDVYGYVF